LAEKTKEVGIKIKLYGVKYSDNKTLISDIRKAIRKRTVRPITGSPEKPVVYIIEPLLAYDYG